MLQLTNANAAVALKLLKVLAAAEWSVELQSE